MWWMPELSSGFPFNIPSVEIFLRYFLWRLREKKIILRNCFATWKCKFRMQCISRGGLCREVVTSVDSFLMPCYAEVTPMMSYVDKWLTSCYAQVAFSARLSNRVACCSKCLPYITAKTLVVCCKCNLKSRGYR